MTRQQALLTHLKTGGKLSIKTAYNYFGVSNISREIRRLVEKPFNIELIREKNTAKQNMVHRAYGMSIQLQNPHRKKSQVF